MCCNKLQYNTMKRLHEHCGVTPGQCSLRQTHDPPFVTVCGFRLCQSTLIRLIETANPPTSSAGTVSVLGFTPYPCTHTLTAGAPHQYAAVGGMHIHISLCNVLGDHYTPLEATVGLLQRCLSKLSPSIQVVNRTFPVVKL